VVMHFVGASAFSADWAAMLRRIIGELQQHLDIEEEIPDEPAALRTAFANWLHMAAGRGRVILVLDGLDQLDDHEGAPDLVWLPHVLPSGLRVIFSTLPGRPLDELSKRSAERLEVEPLEPSERSELIVEYLRQFGRALGQHHIDRIVGAPQTANPLYLRALLEELRVWGEHETLARRIDHYLTASTIDALYELILERYEADYERDRPGLVEDAMSLIWAARRGLSEAELMELLGRDGEPLPRAYWSPLYLAAEPSLVIRSGLVDFFHDYLRHAVSRRYLAGDGRARAVHLQLADYFDQRRDSARAVDELPWQLAEAAAWPRLRELLVDPDFFNSLWRHDEFGTQGQSSGHALRTYWARIEAGSPLRLLDGCQELLDGPAGTNPLTVWSIAALLRGVGYRSVAADVMGRVADHFRESDDAPRRARALGDQAALLVEAGEMDAAVPLLKEQERICREIDDHVGLQRTLGNQASALLLRDDFDAATPLLEEQERIARELGDLDGVATSRMNQAAILKTRGELDRALELLDEAEQLRRQLGDRDGLGTVLVNRAGVLLQRGQPDQAMALLRDAEQISREVGDPAGVESAMRGQVLVLRERGDLRRALEVVTEAEEMCRRMPDRASARRLQRLLAEHASILSDRNDNVGAASVFLEHAEVCRRLGDEKGLARSLHVRGLLMVGLGRPAEALPLLDEAHETSVAQGLTDLAAQIDPLRQVLKRSV